MQTMRSMDDQGVDVNLNEQDGQTALHMAIKKKLAIR